VALEALAALRKRGSNNKQNDPPGGTTGRVLVGAAWMRRRAELNSNFDQ
jgi:hypothetical protein